MIKFLNNLFDLVIAVAFMLNVVDIFLVDIPFIKDSSTNAILLGIILITFYFIDRGDI